MAPPARVTSCRADSRLNVFGLATTTHSFPEMGDAILVADWRVNADRH